MSDWTPKDERNYGAVIQRLKTAIHKVERGNESARVEVLRLREDLAELNKRRVWP